MKRHRPGNLKEESSSDEEEDFFSNPIGTHSTNKKYMVAPEQTKGDNEVTMAVSLGCAEMMNNSLSDRHAVVRHHKMNTKRKSKLDLIISELEEDRSNLNTGIEASKRSEDVSPQTTSNPSDVLTTNIHVGNISRTVTRERFQKVFQEFGELRSVRFLQPKNDYELKRNTLSAFVCFRLRRDAENVMVRCDGRDIFRTGRRVFLSWGKAVSDNDISEEKTKGLADVDALGSLTEEQARILDRLFKKELSTSRKAICRGMAFALEHGHAVNQIAEELRTLFTDPDFVDTDTRIARLYLLSDILHNSQQPGIANAGSYRRKIEEMALEVFGALGNHSRTYGRLNKDKMTRAVRRVLAAWTNWGVFNPDYLRQIDRHYEGDVRESGLKPDSQELHDTGLSPEANIVQKQSSQDDMDVLEQKSIDGIDKVEVKGEIDEMFDEDLDGEPIDCSTGS